MTWSRALSPKLSQVSKHFLTVVGKSEASTYEVVLSDLKLSFLCLALDFIRFYGAFDQTWLL